MRNKTLEISCRDCQGYHKLQVNEQDLIDRQNGKMVQDAMPYLTPAERELLISGICGDCFDNIFAGIDEEDEDEEDEDEEDED